MKCQKNRVRRRPIPYVPILVSSDESSSSDEEGPVYNLDQRIQIERLRRLIPSIPKGASDFYVINAAIQYIKELQAKLDLMKKVQKSFEDNETEFQLQFPILLLPWQRKPLGELKNTTKSLVSSLFPNPKKSDSKNGDNKNGGSKNGGSKNRDSKSV